MSISFMLMEKPWNALINESEYNEFSMENHIENLEGEVLVKADWAPHGGNWRLLYDVLGLDTDCNAGSEVYEKRKALADAVYNFLLSEPEYITLEYALTLQKTIALCDCKRQEFSVLFVSEKQQPDKIHLVLSSQTPFQIPPDRDTRKNYALATFVIKRSSPSLKHLAINKVREFFGEGDAVRSRLPLPDHLKRQL